jgi:hypothetical protein
MSIEKRYYDLSFTDITEALIIKLDLHDGLWGVRATFGIGAANISGPAGKMVPTAMVPLLSIGLQSFEEPNDLTVDAAKFNPVRKNRSRKHRK